MMAARWDTREETMARKVRDKELDNCTARLKFGARSKPYFRKIRAGVDGGYRRLKGERDGTFVARRYRGDHRHETNV
jgi:hypothetical protein